MQSTPVIALACMVAVACAPSANPDRDGDGTPNFDDCQPDDPTSYPGAREVCDGVDNDCDTRIDNGLNAIWYTDNDGDGFGDPNNMVEACDQPNRAVAVAGDCDDNDSATFPGATERCDGHDNDCDKKIDEPIARFDFNTDPSSAEIKLTGAAAYTQDATNFNDGVLRLTPATLQKQGGAWLQTRASADVFQIRFEARLSSIGQTDGEGMALVLVSDDVETVVGRPGRDLGIYGAPVDGLVIELDPYKNDADDTNGSSRHVAIHEITSVSRLGENPAPPFFNDSAWHAWQVTIRGTEIEIVFDDTVVVFGPTNLPFTLGPKVSIGFTAATSERAMQFGIDDVVVGCPDVVDEPADTGEDDTAGN